MKLICVGCSTEQVLNSVPALDPALNGWWLVPAERGWLCPDCVRAAYDKAEAKACAGVTE